MADQQPPDADGEQRRGTGFLATTLSVLAAGFGVQSKEALERDFAHGKASHFIIGGLIGTALFCFAVYGLVLWVINNP